MPRTTETALATFTLPARAGQPAISRLLNVFTAVFGRWDERRNSRRALARLDVHMLRDIGLSASARDDESAKPFWRG